MLSTEELGFDVSPLVRYFKTSFLYIPRQYPWETEPLYKLFHMPSRFTWLLLVRRFFRFRRPHGLSLETNAGTLELRQHLLLRSKASLKIGRIISLRKMIPRESEIFS